jgi:hypothetical protein
MGSYVVRANGHEFDETYNQSCVLFFLKKVDWAYRRSSVDPAVASPAMPVECSPVLISLSGSVLGDTAAARAPTHVEDAEHQPIPTKGTELSETPQSNESYYPPQAPPVQTMQSREMFEGQKHAQRSLIFGILGLFFLGVVFGPLAIVSANKAERLHIPATAGKVLGWISAVWGAIAIIIFIVLMGSMLAAMGNA